MVEAVSVSFMLGNVLGVLFLTAAFVFCVLLVISLFSFKKAWFRFKTRTAAVITVLLSILPALMQVGLA